MQSIVAARAIENRDFRSRVRHFIIKTAVNAVRQPRELETQLDPVTLEGKHYMKERAILGREILANPDSFITAFGLAALTEKKLDHVDDFGLIEDDDLGFVINLVYDCFLKQVPHG